MPKLKQPIPLKDISMDVLVGFLANYCDKICAEECLEKLVHLVADIKREICPNIPWNLSAEFCKKFLQEFQDLWELRSDPPSDVYQRAVLEIIMDREITGLKFEGPIITSLDTSDARRIQGIRLLNLSCFSHFSHLSLANFRLPNLTTFIYLDGCTDENLTIIGLRCPNLVYLDVTNSKSVTDRGLRRLYPCSKLRFVFLSFCRISERGIYELLSENTNIENFSAWTNSKEDGFDCFSQPEEYMDSYFSPSTVYESISKFTIVLNRVLDWHLRSVVVKFPNLTSLGFSGFLTGDLCILKYLRNLSRLDFSKASGFSWDKLMRVLPLMGSKISDLRTRCSSESTACLIQSDLNFLFQICPNIEHLEFDYRARFDREILGIPPFKKLKHLNCRIPREYHRRKAALEFGEMLELENLTMDRFHVTDNTVISMILDNDKFPNLKVMRVSKVSGKDDIDQIVTDNNLDFEITLI